MLPGQCIPVVLFVFQDDISDVSNPVTNTDDAMDSSRQNLTLKGSGSVLMLARPASKAEGSFRKRLQSSLEGQIRFLIKKCRILAGTDHSHFGSRGVGKVNSLPLFSLDASRVVTLLNRSMNQRGEALSYVTSLIEEALNSKAKADMPMLENHCQNLHNDDVQAINDFISRQVDMLRGRGGLLGNANSGSVAGVGMVAAAAAAAAVSAASATPSKPVNAPELPSMENWYASTYLLLKALLHIGHGFRDDRGNIKVIPLEPTVLDTRDKHALENAISCLENNKGMNMKFSASWCQRVFTIAKDVYLKDLPTCYPTSIHNSHLENALLSFCSMVKGPAVKLFAKKLADDCTSIWEAGRQLCDAISLTGKPCMHRRHGACNSNSMKEDTPNQHSSGNVFLHACACGRSRCMRDDPFDFQSANVTFNHFIGCESTLPTLSLPHLSNNGPLPPASWSLLRIGGTRYYEPSKGLLQPGFCSTQKFLMKWLVAIEKEANGIPVGVTKNNLIVSLIPQSNTKLDVDEMMTKSNDDCVMQHISETREKQPALVASNATSINFGNGLPSFTLKKPFVEVVTSTIVADLRPQQRKQTKHVKGVRVSSAIGDKNLTIENQHASKQGEPVVSLQCSTIPKSDSHVDGNPYLQIGTNIVPVNIFNSQEIKTSSLRKSIVYVGFEHECSYGHRFLLSSDHLKGLDSSYPLTSKPYPSSESFKGKHLESKVKAHEKVDCYSSSKRVEISTGIKKDNMLNKSTETGCVQGDESLTFLSRVGIDKLQSGRGLMLSESVHQVERKISHVKLDDSSYAYSMLASNLPVYMNCPYCNSSAKQAKQNDKFASKVSQLQRIFLVTPSFPTVLATCPVIQFEQSCLPESTPNLEQQSQFSLDCLVTLPPESFITIRLPFIYGVRMNDGLLQPLDYIVHKPELTAWLIKGTALQVVSMGCESDEEFQIL
ncbi:hypothetical protein HPP92_025769 [Vanilla planifolia]|uniref:Nonsense-mediated mRNA decay factor SMG8 n=1 Tax=Vanilla planifolia TaxID=51239 RepID=A0A835PIM3_VANPL|nr:hypothetical protein HPP92_025769 [Vanilla planifolia]